MNRAQLIMTLSAVLLMAGCSTVSMVATHVAVDQGAISQDEADSINRVVVAAEKYWSDITPEQEHYIGRAVAATLLDTYAPLDDSQANDYLNRLGQALALACDRPETYGGYHFLLLDSDEINAFACPGGLILVSRGLVACCGGEDQLASVLAHEIGHVAGKHGLRSIKSGRLTSALTIMAAEGSRNFGGESLATLVDDLEGSIDDITQSLVSSGYSRGLEREADLEAVAIMNTVGYNARGLATMLEEMNARWEPHGPGFMRTHPSPADRLVDIQPAVASLAPLAPPRVRQARFDTAVGHLVKSGG